MNGTLLAFVLTLLFGSVIGIATVKKTTRQRDWLDEIESKRSVERTGDTSLFYGKGDRSRRSTGA